MAAFQSVLPSEMVGELRDTLPCGLFAAEAPALLALHLKPAVSGVAGLPDPAFTEASPMTPKSRLRGQAHRVPKAECGAAKEPGPMPSD